MTANQSDRTDSEPTLTDIVKKLDKLSTEVEKFNHRFTNYQEATQWVVQLAFTLIASATITIIVTTILRR